MNLKRTFGAILTVLGIIGIIYGAYLFMTASNNWRAYVVAFGVGAVFFASGISLVKTTKDES